MRTLLHKSAAVIAEQQKRYDELVDELRIKFADKLLVAAEKFKEERDRTASLHRQLDEAGETVTTLREETGSVRVRVRVCMYA